METTKVQIESSEERLSTLPYSLSDEYRNRMGKNIDLTPVQERNLKAWLKARLSEWEEDTDERNKNLIWDNDLVEGIVDPTDFPFEGASNAHVPITETYMEVYKSILKRSMLGADVIWYGETDEEALFDVLVDVEGMLNYKARNEWNIESALKDVIWTTCRDGLGVMQIPWVEEYEQAADVILLTNMDDFMAEFPTPEEAGLSPEEWRQLAQMVMSQASDEFPVEVPVTFERRTYYGNKGEVIELADFVTIPAMVRDIKDDRCRGYGKRYVTRSGSLRQKAKDGVFYKDKVNQLIAKCAGESALTEFETAKNDIEGISHTNSKDDIPVFELVVKGRLNGIDSKTEDDRYDVERKFLVTYSKERDILLQCAEYWYRVDFYALFKINGRPNRLVGRSIPKKTRDLNDVIDTQYNQRINSRTISSVPTFKALASKKKELDPTLRENKWGPGRIFWVESFDSFDQFKIQPTDLGESIQEEQNARNILDLYLGSAVALLSGGAPTGDPNAPGNKTAMLLQQSNLRMDDPLDEFREGVEDVGNICLSNLYQFGTPLLQWQSQDETAAGPRREVKTLHKKYLRKGLRMKMSGVTVTMNPEAEMAKELQLHQAMLTMEPLYAQNDALRVEGLRHALRKGRVPGRTRRLPSADEIHAMQVEIQKQAMMKMALEQKVAEEQQREALVQDNLKRAKSEMNVRKTAEQMATSGLALNGAAQ